MHRVSTPAGITISYDRYGSGPPLVLVHGSFSDHNTNWDFVRSLLTRQFTLYAVARRGRGESERTEGNRIEDEGRDVAAVIRSIEQSVFLLGHSYGAHVALVAASDLQDRVRKLVLYEPAWPQAVDSAILTRLEEFAGACDWNAFATTFFHEKLLAPLELLSELRPTELWADHCRRSGIAARSARAEPVRFLARAFPRFAHSRAASDGGGKSAPSLRHRRARRRSAGGFHSGAEGSGARGDDLGTEDLCRSRDALFAGVA